MMRTIVWTHPAIGDRVRQFLCESFLAEKTESSLGADDELIRILDSLQLLRMVMELEGTFGITVDYSELTLENLGTLRRIATFVVAKLNP